MIDSHGSHNFQIWNNFYDIIYDAEKVWLEIYLISVVQTSWQQNNNALRKWDIFDNFKHCRNLKKLIELLVSKSDESNRILMKSF